MTISAVAHDDSFATSAGCTTCHTAIASQTTHVNGTFTGDGMVAGDRTAMGLGSFTAYTPVSTANNGTGTCAGTGAPPTGVNTGCHDLGDGGTWKREWDSVNAYATLASLNTCKGCHGAAAADFTFGTAHNATDGQTEHAYNWDGDADAEIMNAGTHNGCKVCHGVATATTYNDAHAGYTVGANLARRTSCSGSVPVPTCDFEHCTPGAL